MNKNIKKLFNGKTKWISLGIIIILLGIFYFTNRNESQNYTTTIVIRENIKQEVLISGTVKAQTIIDVAFEKNGTVSWINKKIGEKIKAGNTIVAIKNNSELASLSEAKALLQTKKSHLQELSTGSRPEELNIKELAVKSEERKLINYYNTVAQVINSAFNNADNAINKQADNMFSNDNSHSPQLTFSVNDQQIENDVILLRESVNDTLNKLNMINAEALSGKLDDENYSLSLRKIKNELIVIQNFLIKLTEALNKSSNLTDATLSTYKTSIATGRTNINTSIQAVTSLIENIESQKIIIEKIKNELALLKLGATAEIISQANSEIQQAEAKVQIAQANLEKTIIKSPISGVISRMEISVGEPVQAGKIIASIIGNNNFIIEANLPETDLAKVKVGNATKITLDAFGNDKIFKAKVLSIEPAERLINGITTYKTKFLFSENYSGVGIKPGMTANITIITAEKNNVLTLPISAIQKKSGKTIVSIQDDNKIQEVEIQTGLKEFDKIEIIKGLNEGDIVLIPNK